MRRDFRALLWDAYAAADAISHFVTGRSVEDHNRDLMLRSAIERQFEIMGEARIGRPRHCLAYH